MKTFYYLCEKTKSCHIVDFLKLNDPYFNEVWINRKLFEVRNNDRNFISGNLVFLYHPSDLRVMGAEIGYVLRDFPALNPDFVVFQLLDKINLPYLYDPQNINQIVSFYLENRR